MQTVLFVDDEPKVLNGLRRSLWALRHEWDLNFALGADEALDILTEKPVDVVVSDMKMPGKDGATFLNEVAKKYPSCIRYVLSGESNLGATYNVLNASHTFIQKPANSARMIEKLSSITAHQGEKLKKRTLLSSHYCYSQRSVTKLLADATTPLTHLEPIVTAAKEDVGLATRVIQLANAAYFGVCQEPVLGIEKAVERLGGEVMVNLVHKDLLFAEPEDETTDALVTEINTEAKVKRKKAERLAENLFHDEDLTEHVGQIVFLSFATALLREDVQNYAARKTDKNYGGWLFNNSSYLFDVWHMPEDLWRPMLLLRREDMPLNARYAKLALVLSLMLEWESTESLARAVQRVPAHILLETGHTHDALLAALVKG